MIPSQIELATLTFNENELRELLMKMKSKAGLNSGSPTPELAT